MNKNTATSILFGLGIMGVVILLCWILRVFLDYKIVALILLTTVSVLALILDIIPVLVLALASAIALNVFFIEPLYTYKINSSENILLFFIYLLVALVSGVWSYRIRKKEQELRDKEEKSNSILLYNTLINSLSHELKTPISILLGGLGILKSNSISDTAEIVKEMEEATLRLNKDVNNLLNINRIETGHLKLKRDWCDLNEVIFILLSKLKRKETIQFAAVDDLPLVKIDAGLIEIALQGILENAIRYCPEEAIISISIFLEEEKVRIEIRDNGPGINIEDIPFVFDKFYRGSNVGTGGTGLGLSISKGLIEAHGGDIQLIVNNGCNFICSIPTAFSYLKNIKNE